MVSGAEAGHGTLHRYFAAMAYRDFRLMFFANFFGQAAAWSLIAARGWFVFDHTHSTSAVGITTFAAMGPVFIVPPFAGVLADRMDRRTLLAWTYAVNLIQNLLLALLALTGLIEVWHVIALTLVNGIARAVQLPTSQALAANLVPRHALLNALSLNAATLHGSRLVGSGVVTALIVWIGAPAAFLLGAVFYAAGWVQLIQIRTRSRGEVREGESFVENFIDGLRYAFRQPLIRMVLVLVFFHCGFTMAYESLLPAFAHQTLALYDEGFGILLTAIGFGGLIGSLYIGGIRSALARGRWLLVMGVLSGASQMLLALAPGLLLAVGAAVLMGISQAAYMTMGQAITQSLALDAYRGRLASINTFSLGGVMSLMNLVNGFFGGYVSSAFLLFVNGGVFVAVIALSILAFTPRRVYVRGIPAEAHAA